MAVLNTTSPARSAGAPKLLPSKTLPSSKARTARFNRLFLLGLGNSYFSVGRGGCVGPKPRLTRNRTVTPLLVPATPQHAVSGGVSAPCRPPHACSENRGPAFSRRHRRRRLGCTVPPCDGSAAWFFVPTGAQTTALLRLPQRPPPASCSILHPPNELTFLPPEEPLQYKFHRAVPNSPAAARNSRSTTAGAERSNIMDGIRVAPCSGR